MKSRRICLTIFLPIWFGVLGSITKMVRSEYQSKRAWMTHTAEGRPPLFSSTQTSSAEELGFYPSGFV